MCYSAEVSFGSSVALISVGGWCLRTAYHKVRWIWPLAIVPCFFAVQQAAEGFVWIGLENNANELVKYSASIYLFFALAFWPIWFCIALWLMETDKKRRTFLAVWAWLSTAWFFAVFVPAVSQLYEEQGIAQVRQEHHSVRYEYPDQGGVWPDPIGRWTQRILYIATVSIPALISRARPFILIPMSIAVVSAFVTALLFDHAFTSVWCLWSALASLLLSVAISKAATESPTSGF